VDLVLLDLLLEGMDGITVLEHMRRRHIEVPVVIVSGINRSWTAATAMRLGAVDYIEKPFHDNELLSTVMSTVRRSIEATHLGLTSHGARILLISCPIGLAASMAAALVMHARVEAIPASASDSSRPSG